MRRLVAAVAALWLIASLFPVTIAAAPHRPAIAPPVSQDDGGTCYEVRDGYWSWEDTTGHTSTNAITSRSGVSANLVRDPLDIDPPGGGAGPGMEPCYWTLGDLGNNGVLAYLELFPRNATGGCPAGPHSSCYVRLGIAQCVDGAMNFCGSGPEPDAHIFIETHGCGYHSRWDKGITNDYDMPMYFYEDYGNIWRFFANGNSLGTILESSSALSCWINGTINGAGWFFREWDEADSLGRTPGPAPSGFYATKFGVFGQGWSNTNFNVSGSAPCQYIAPVGGAVCSTLTDTSIGLYDYAP
jgi:hypothetical protein